MNIDRKDPIDRAIDEVLASMVGGEPRRVSAASVRRATGESRRFRLPVWLAVAAILVVALAVALKSRAPTPGTPALVAGSAAAPSPAQVRPAPSPDPMQGRQVTLAHPGRSRRLNVRTTTSLPYEGLPRLTVASIDLPEPLFTRGLDADPIQIPHLEIAPLFVSGLSNEPEHK